jgi:hypothetical protein
MKHELQAAATAMMVIMPHTNFERRQGLDGKAVQRLIRYSLANPILVPCHDFGGASSTAYKCLASLHDAHDPSFASQHSGSPLEHEVPHRHRPVTFIRTEVFHINIDCESQRLKKNCTVRQI